MSNLQQESIDLHTKNKGKIETGLKVSLENRHDLSLAYTPGIGAVCQQIASEPAQAEKLTIKGNSVAVISDGSAVLGLGNIGPLASLPVMEGKAAIFKRFANIDAWPIILGVHTTAEIVATIKAISSGFAGINLEDIAAPQCFEIEEQLQDLGIPVMHDDQHGTAIVVYAALLNAAKVTGKSISDLTVVVNGAGAAGLAVTKMLINFYQTGNARVKDLILCDSKGIITANRQDLNSYKNELLPLLNKSNKQGTLTNALEQADVFIGLSVANVLTPEMVKTMNANPIIFALANPIPEIMPDLAYQSGAAIVGTGRSDLPNQINNALVFPGIFRAALDQKRHQITPVMKYACAKAIAETITPEKDSILPDIFHPNLIENIVREVGRV